MNGWVWGERVSNECVGGKVMWGTEGEYDECVREGGDRVNESGE